MSEQSSADVWELDLQVDAFRRYMINDRKFHANKIKLEAIRALHRKVKIMLLYIANIRIIRVSSETLAHATPNFLLVTRRVMLNNATRSHDTETTLPCLITLSTSSSTVGPL